MKNKILIREIPDTDFDPKHQMSRQDEYAIGKASRGTLINNSKSM